MLLSPRLLLLAIQQANKLRDEMLGQGIDFILQSSQLRRWQTSVPKNYLPYIRIQASFMLKGKGCGSDVANLGASNFVPAFL